MIIEILIGLGVLIGIFGLMILSGWILSSLFEGDWVFDMDMFFDYLIRGFGTLISLACLFLLAWVIGYIILNWNTILK
jgi:hypothetical protein